MTTLCYMCGNCSLFCGGAPTPMIQDRLQFFITFVMIIQTCVHVKTFFECKFCFFMEILILSFILYPFSQSLPNSIIVKFLTIITCPKFKNPAKSILFTLSHSQFSTKYVRVDIRQFLLFPSVLL